MYALPTTRRDGKTTTSNIIQGTLLGYGGSMKKSVYLNDRTGKIGRATRATFDEAQLSSPVAGLSPTSLALWGALNRATASDVPVTADGITPPDQLCVFSVPSPFLAVATVVILVCCTFDHLGLVFESDPMSYRNINCLTDGPTLMICQVDDIMVSAASRKDRLGVLDGIASTVSFNISKDCTSLFYATDISQTALYIKVSATFYITSCLLKLGWDTTFKDGAVLVPMPPLTVKDMSKSLDPGDIAALVKQYGFQYRTLTGMLIFAVQIGRFDVAPAVSILCKFNNRPGAVHFLAANNVMRYLCSTSRRGLVYWRPMGKERPDLPRVDLTPYRPEANIDGLFPRDFPMLEPVCYVDASYGGLLTLGEPRSITGIVITLGGMAIFAKTRIQRTTALSSIESETMTGC
jgi:hypothetical protein